jgi:Domain of unknown function (DUF1835)
LKTVLNITNGDSAVSVMKLAGMQGDFLPWRDVLHDGPVPDKLSLEELSEIRAQFITEKGWGQPEQIKESFIERDNKLKSYNKYEKIVLWFEHDLYDQLHVLQILDWFNHNWQKEPPLHIICVDKYLGTLNSDEIKILFKHEKIVTQNQLRLASNAWSAFCSSSPEEWANLLSERTESLPFLADAILRLLQEYPHCGSGLSLTAMKALEIVNNGEKRPWKIFEKYQKSELRRFLGDSSFWEILRELTECKPALLKLSLGKNKLTLPPSPDQELSITKFGKDVLAGEKNLLESKKYDCWIGGVHLTSENIWCWNPDSRTLNKL